MARASRRSRRFWGTAEGLAWVTGIVCLVGSGGWYLDGVIARGQAIRQFSELQDAAKPREATDVTLWSQERINAWLATLDLTPQAPLAVLRIPRIGLEVPVLPGTDELTLNRGAGHIEDTAVPGTDGNSGIAGHRDGFFRRLKDIARGDVIELDTLQGKEIYRVERIWIVSPDDVWVLDPTIDRTLTLVTCHPFYFVGSAPNRFIVRAVRVQTT